MNIAIVARSQGEAQDIIKFYGIERRKDNVTVFTKPEQVYGVSLAGFLVVTANMVELVRPSVEASRVFRYKIMEFLK